MTHFSQERSNYVSSANNKRQSKVASSIAYKQQVTLSTESARLPVQPKGPILDSTGISNSEVHAEVRLAS